MNFIMQSKPIQHAVYSFSSNDGGPLIPPGIVLPEGADGVGHGESGDRLE